MTSSMDYLAKKFNYIFLYPSDCSYESNPIINSLKTVPYFKKIPTPGGQLQLQMSLGMAMDGYSVVTIFPHITNFLPCLSDLVNTIGKIDDIWENAIKPNIIIRVGYDDKSDMVSRQYKMDAVNFLTKTILDDNESIVNVFDLQGPSLIYEANDRGGIYLFLERLALYTNLNDTKSEASN